MPLSAPYTVSKHGVITVTGGKLTTYRKMAEDTVDVVMRAVGRRGRCRTRRLRLLGTMSDPASHLDSRYGTFAAAVRQLADSDPTLGQPLVEGLPYLGAEAVYAARHEMARSVDDVLSRRTRARLVDCDAAIAAAPRTAALLATELGWDATETARQVEAFVQLCAAEAATIRAPPAATQRPPAATQRPPAATQRRSPA